MVTFYPMRIKLWEDVFDFTKQNKSNSITAIKKEFNTKDEFYAFIKKYFDENNNGRYGRKNPLDFDLITIGKDLAQLDSNTVDMLLYNHDCIGWVKFDEETKITVEQWNNKKIDNSHRKDAYINMKPENNKEFGEELNPESIFELDVDEILSSISSILKEKNKKYGDAALNPKRIFSKVSSVEQLKVRIDDKLSRISNMGTDVAVDEDTLTDLIGYLVLLKIAIKRKTISKD